MTGTSASPVLTVNQLWFSYPDRPVLRGLSAAFEPGLTWIRGANGCGKSTFLRLMGGALEPTSGSRNVCGIDAARRPLEYRREVFWCGPASLSMGHLTAAEYFGLLKGLYPRFDAGELPRHLLGFGLDEVLSRPIAALSTGTQRKLWLTAALAVGTSAVLLDEPLNALDEPSLAYARDTLADCARSGRSAWIVASHVDPCHGQAATRVLTMTAA